MIHEEDTIKTPIVLTPGGKIATLFSILFLFLSYYAAATPVFLITAFLLIYIAVSYTTFFNNDRPISAEIEIHNASVYENELISISAIITNKSTRPRIVDIQLMVGEKIFFVDETVKARIVLQPLETKQYTFHFVSQERGTIEIGPLVIKQKDTLGLLERHIATSNKFLIRAFPEKVGQPVPVAYRREVISKLIGLFAMRVKGFGTEFYGLRDYVRGDPIRTIDWKATAKEQRLITREYEDEKRLTVFIAVDTSYSMRGKKFNYALTATQDIAQTVIELGHSCGVIVFADQLISYFPPSDSPRFAYNIWQNFFTLEPSDTKADYSIVTQLIYSKHFTRSLIIFISDTEQDMAKKQYEIRNIRLRENNVILLDLWGYPFLLEPEIMDTLRKTSDPEQALLLGKYLHPYELFVHVERAEQARKDLIKIGAKYASIASLDTSPFHALEHLIRQEMQRIKH